MNNQTPVLASDHIVSIYEYLIETGFLNPENIVEFGGELWEYDGTEYAKLDKIKLKDKVFSMHRLRLANSKSRIFIPKTGTPKTLYNFIKTFNESYLSVNGLPSAQEKFEEYKGFPRYLNIFDDKENK